MKDIGETQETFETFHSVIKMFWLQTRLEKIWLPKKKEVVRLLQLKKEEEKKLQPFYHFFGLYLYFLNFLQLWKTGLQFFLLIYT